VPVSINLIAQEEQKMNDRQVQLQISTSQKYLPAHSTATIYLMLKIIQPKITLDTNRLPHYQYIWRATCFEFKS